MCCNAAAAAAAEGGLSEEARDLPVEKVDQEVGPRGGLEAVWV